MTDLTFASRLDIYQMDIYRTDIYQMTCYFLQNTIIRLGLESPLEVWDVKDSGRELDLSQMTERTLDLTQTRSLENSSGGETHQLCLL